MLWFNPYLAERLAEELRNDAMREAEHARLIRAVKGSRKVQNRGLSVTLAPKGLLALFMQPQSR